MSSNKTTLLALLLVSVACAKSTTPTAETRPSQVRENITFISVALDKDTADADLRLKRFLEPKIEQSFNAGSSHHNRFPQQMMPYEEVIRALADRDPGRGYLARVTPYAYVASEMLGAQLDILATYRSVATQDMTYHSYFVVPKEEFYRRLEEFHGRTQLKTDDEGATVEDLIDYLKSFTTKPAKATSLKPATALAHKPAKALTLKPARFIYHDRFSTSSYFLPSLVFKEHQVFAMSQSINPELIPIQVERFLTTSSAELVNQVANGDADLAAVWDGTKNKFKKATDSGLASVSARVLFIEIPTDLPNDFLVASGISEKTRGVIIDSIRNDPGAGRPCTDLGEIVSTPADKGRRRCEDSVFKKRPADDFDGWYAWNSNDGATDEAREALAQLRLKARERPWPVVVKVEAKPTTEAETEPGLGFPGLGWLFRAGEADKRAKAKKRDETLEAYVSAAKEAVRLSGTEFVLFDEDLHKNVDMTWTLESIHDGALKLTSTLDATFGKSDDEFRVSFMDRNDLPKRIADFVRSRLRRIRYVWPYEEKYPAVLRDLDFTPDRGVFVQKISWINPIRNQYEEDTPFPARIKSNTDFSKFQLSDEIKFPRNPETGALNFEPMSNIAYRVIITREPHAGWIWVIQPYCSIGLFVLACAGLAVDLRRRQPRPKGLLQTYERMVETYHRPWRGKEIEEGEILWSDPKSIDEFVRELKTKGSFLGLVRSGGFDFNVGPVPVRLSLLMKLAALLTGRGRATGGLVEVAEAGNVAALDRLIQFLIYGRRLSPFIGSPDPAGAGSTALAWPLEWQALNDIASRHFQQLGIGRKQIDVSLVEQNGALSAAVSSHFRGVMKRSAREASLFCQTWTLREKGVTGRLVYEQNMRSPLSSSNGGGQASSVRLEVVMPTDTVLPVAADQSEIRAWVLGKVLTWSMEQETLLLQVKPMAILRDHAP